MSSATREPDALSSSYLPLGFDGRKRRLSPLWAFAKSRPLGAICGVLLVIVMGMAVFADVLAPYSPSEQHAIDAFKSPDGTYLLGTDIRTRRRAEHTSVLRGDASALDGCIEG